MTYTHTYVKNKTLGVKEETENQKNINCRQVAVIKGKYLNLFYNGKAGRESCHKGRALPQISFTPLQH